MIPFMLALCIVTFSAIMMARSNSDMPAKVFIITLLILSSILTWKLLENYQGLPVTISEIPARVVVCGQTVDEANDKIYMRILEEDQEHPALYIVTKYTEALHEALAKGKEKFKGDEFALEASGKVGEGDEDGDGENNKEKDKGGSISLDSASFKIGELPTPKLPRKEL